MAENLVWFLAKILWDVVWHYLRRFLDRKPR
mgnify:CR=1 FL=1